MDKNIEQILRMVEEGKISAADAATLISAVSAKAEEPKSSKTNGAKPENAKAASPKEEEPVAEEVGASRTFHFEWGKKTGFPVDFGKLGDQIRDTVRGLEPEKFIKDVKAGNFKINLPKWADFGGHGEEGAVPRNAANQPTANATETTSYDLQHGATLQVTNHHGSISVVGGSEKCEVEFKKEAWDQTAAEAELRLSGARLAAMTHAGDEGMIQRLELRVDAGEDWYDGLLNVVVRVPKNVTVITDTVFGEASIEKVSGTVQARSVSGAIQFKDGGETVHLQSVSGDVKAENPTGAIRMKSVSGLVDLENASSGGELQSVSGHIHAKEIGGEWDVSNTSGDIRLESGAKVKSANISNVSGAIELTDVSGVITASTMSGRIYAREFRATTAQMNSKSGAVECDFVNHVDGTVSVSTLSGAATISTAPGSNYRYTLETQSGGIEDQSGGKSDASTKTLRTGTVGKGKGGINIRTLSGSITLKARSAE